jgi:hypothetical protein
MAGPDPIGRNSPEIRKMRVRVKLAPSLLVLRGMSVLRTMSLIVGGALFALGGSAVALFL